jgi:hypothetical protein
MGGRAWWASRCACYGESRFNLTVSVYDPSEHVMVLDVPWSEEDARSAIARTVDDLVWGWSRDDAWTIHPDDLEEGDVARNEPGLYHGAAGNVWALMSLGDAGYSVALDLHSAAQRALRARSMWAGESWYETSYMAGELGPAVVSALLGDDSQHARIADLIERNLGNASHSVFIGAPGSMLAAIAMYERSGEPMWRQLFERGLERLWSAWQPVSESVYLWKQYLYGRDVPSYIIGAAHGFAGAVAVVLRGRELLDEPRRVETWRRAISTAKALAKRAGPHVNWPKTHVDAPRFPLQWCFGAPGIVAALSAIPAGIDEEFDRLMLEGGETIWNAGPLAKGAGICHGTAGNGFALLALHARTGDALWLRRARTFGMNAIAQTRAQHARWGRPWFSLWTGDSGVAIFLQACLSDAPGILSFGKF